MARRPPQAKGRGEGPAQAPTLESAPAGWLGLDRVPLVAAILALAVYLPSVGGTFVYDDEYLIVRNRSIRDLAALGTILRWNSARPVLNLSWALNYVVSGLEPWSYHLVNVLIHAGSAALLAWLFLWIGGRAGLSRPRHAALAAACFFAASPMAAETVAYVASRSTGLSALLGLACLRLGVGVLENPSGLRLSASLAFLALALATKEEAASVPLLLLLLDLFFVARQRVSDLARRWRTHALHLAVPALGLLARRLATGVWLPEPETSRLHYAVVEWAAFPLYLLRALVPIDPALYRGHAEVWPPPPSTLLWCLVATAVVASAIALWKRWPLWSFAVAWLAAALLPSSSVVPLGETMVDHRAYLGSAGVALLAGALLSRPRSIVPAAAVVALLAARSVQYERVLADPIRAWQDGVRRAPRSALARRGLADAYTAAGDPRAEATLREALELDPRDLKSWTNLGTYYGGQGRLGEAEQAFRNALALDPKDTEAYIRDNLGVILEAQGREAEAQAEFEKACAAQPRLVRPRIDLARILFAHGEDLRPRALLDEAVALQPTPEEAQWIQRLRDARPPGRGGR